MAKNLKANAASDNAGNPFNNDFELTVSGPKGKTHRKKVGKNPVSFPLDDGTGRYLSRITTGIGTSVTGGDQESLWANDFAPTGSFVDETIHDFDVIMGRADFDGSSDIPQTLTVTPIAPVPLGQAGETSEEIALVLVGLAVAFSGWAAHDAKGLAGATAKLHAVLKSFVGSTFTQTDDLGEEESEDNVSLADRKTQPIHPKALCSQCLALYNTPNTPYFHNITWYNACVTNPPCT